MFAQVALSLVFGLAATAAPSSTANTTVVCVAGQCLQGFTNTTLGATLSASGVPTAIRILPGQYSSNTNPQLLHNLLTSSSAQLSPAPGFENASLSSLPMNLALQPGLSVFPGSLYSGDSQFSPLPTSPSINATQDATPLSAGSLLLATDIWVALASSGSSSSSSSNRVVFWDSVPDISQLPPSLAASSLSLLDIQSSACSPACSGNGVCSPQGTCTCPPGFTGAACESCEAGFFGPSCQPCPADCDSCDEGIAGAGICLKRKITDAPSTCNCLNGLCGPDGSCTCNPGWTNADNGTACAKCASGFFLSSSGDCQICQLGCTSCADGTGTCLTCKTGFTQNANDKTQCIATASTTPSGTVCPDGSFSDGTACKACSPSCKTCSGPTSNDCIVCGNGQYKLGDACVGTNGDGVCEGSSMIADNNKHECDSCPSKCTACKLPNFNVASTVDQLQCTGCLPGHVLSNGKCIESCPTGTFLSASTNTCTPCSSSCSTCTDRADFCLTCANSQLANNGTCVSSCPSSTFTSAGSCVACHPDCATCTGGAFGQCASCPPGRPVLANGRCLPTCGRGEYFDKTTSSCKACDGSCSSCSGPGPSACLACANPTTDVLSAGACSKATCTDNTAVLSGLGVCLSTLVRVPTVVASGTTSALPLPTVSGIDAPTVEAPRNKGLPWWQILLMALGCAFIFLCFLMCWRRRARRQRAQRTRLFAVSKALEPSRSWRERLFGRWPRVFRRTGRGNTAQDTEMGMAPLGPVYLPPGESEARFAASRAEAAARRHEEEKLAIIGGYAHSRNGGAPSTRPPSSIDEDARWERRQRDLFAERAYTDGAGSRLSQGSMFTELTGQRRAGPEVRQPLREGDLLGLHAPGVSSRFSGTTYSTASIEPFTGQAAVRQRAPSPAELYASGVRERLELVPQRTGTSESTNPFLRRAI